MNIFAGSTHPALASSLAQELSVPLGKILLKHFASGECYVKYEQSVRGQEVYLLQAPGVDPHEALFELFLMCQAAKLSFASHVHVILPYFPYSRQDRVSEPREPISAKMMAVLLEKAGADHIITLNLHSDQIQGFFSVPVDVLDARPIFAKYFKSKLENPVVVSPDVGGAKQAKKFADQMGADLAIMQKNRTGHHEAQILEVVGNVQGRTCILFDDMIDTAGTLCTAKAALVEKGANPDVYVAATHALFSGPAIERLKEAKFKEVVVSDSIPPRHQFEGLTVLPIAPLLAEVIQHIESKQSVTDIYKSK
ncbi:ribose-phosphate pyrophosphokinase [Candidatus Peribacteria bacterium]|nr:MAG: ribose-phosphate pyrophosphokinase [Candidatus Peribacteria bacterium]